MGKSIMVLGTASTVGKSFVNTALCRIFLQDGMSCAPFKAQNMSLNSFITVEGAELGRAQAVQAEACGKLPDVRMNPVLLKPATDRRSQVIVNGRVRAMMDAAEYQEYKHTLLGEVQNAYESLLLENDVVVLEGAGSPAEINLKAHDIVNMGMARMAKAPVVLVGDIDKGGVFASLVGTMALLTEEERKYVKGFIINKFRGDPALLTPGLETLTKLTGVPVLGVLPYMDVQIEEEDSVFEKKSYGEDKPEHLDIAVLALPYLSNFTDLHALALEPMVRVRFVKSRKELLQPDLVILPGTKSTMAAADALRQRGLWDAVREYATCGGFVFGICGGYQLLGREIFDPEAVESQTPRCEGLGLLNVQTTFFGKKRTVLSNGEEALFGGQVKGYEIHMGQEKRNGYSDLEQAEPLISCKDATDGAMADGGRIAGTYFHGIFDNGVFCREYLNMVRKRVGKPVYEGPYVDYPAFREKQYDNIADIVRKHLDMEQIYKMMEEGV